MNPHRRRPIGIVRSQSAFDNQSDIVSTELEKQLVDIRICVALPGVWVSLTGQLALVASVLVAKCVHYGRMLSVLDIEAETIGFRSAEHTSELQSLRRMAYAVFCLKKKKNTQQ